MKQHLSKGDIANRTNTPNSTVSFYIDTFKEFIPGRKPDGKKHAVYEPQAIEVIKKIKALFKAKKSRDEIRDELAKQFPPIYDAETPENNKPTTTTQQSVNMVTTTTLQQAQAVVMFNQELTNSAMQSIQHHQKLLKEKDEQLTTLQQRLEEIERENRDLTGRAESLEEENLRLKRKKRGWFR